jgi:phosphopantetheinyl transferase (holo-ACP synthase)
MRWPMTWRSVEIVPEPGGRPRAIANGEFAVFLAGKGLRLHVSLADVSQWAIAQAIAETLTG